MKYVSIACFAVITIHLCNPASAGTGNALSGGWNSALTTQVQRAAPAPAAPSPAVSIGVFASSAISFSSGGGSSGNTGGAPSPEVNAALSLILVGGTVAFLRRRRARRAALSA